MITDKETDFLFIAGCLTRRKKYSSFLMRFAEVLKENNINSCLLPNTKDIWAVDYMPIQIEIGTFIQFVYNPDYLQSKTYLKTISDADAICKTINITTAKSPVIVDGGNVIRGNDKVIMCDKVFKENPGYKEKELIKTLEEAFKVDKLIFVPWDKSDFLGHADGMVRFLDDDTVFINDLSKENHQLQTSFKMSLHNAGLDWIEIPYNPYNNSSRSRANGTFLNFLEISDFVLIPSYGMKEDEEALKIYDTYFCRKKIKTIDCNAIANDGGILNCITWNIKTSNIDLKKIKDFDLIPLYKSNGIILIGLKSDYSNPQNADGLVIKINMDDGSTDFKSCSSQKLLKFGFYEPIPEDQKKLVMAMIYRKFSDNVLSIVQNTLTYPDEESIASLIFVPERLKSNRPL
jgi:agmatine deiminase